jgi:hypothetical protein
MIFLQKRGGAVFGLLSLVCSFWFVVVSSGSVKQLITTSNFKAQQIRNVTV